MKTHTYIALVIALAVFGLYAGWKAGKITHSHIHAK